MLIKAEICGGADDSEHDVTVSRWTDSRLALRVPLAPVAIGFQTFIMIMRWHQIAVVIDPAGFHFCRDAVPIAVHFSGEFCTRRAVAGQPPGTDVAGDGFDVVGGRSHVFEDTISWCKVPYGALAVMRQGGAVMKNAPIVITILVAAFLTACAAPSVDRSALNFNESKFTVDLNFCRGGNIAEASLKTIGKGALGSLAGAGVVALHGAAAAGSGEAIVVGAVVGAVGHLADMILRIAPKTI